MKRIRLFAAAAAVILTMTAGTAYAANGPAGDPYVFGAEVGPGVGLPASEGSTALSAEEQELVDILTKASEEANALPGYEAQYVMNIGLGMNGVDLLDMNGVGNLKFDNADRTNPSFYMDLVMNMTGAGEGTPLNMNMVYKDGYYYMDTDGVKQKAPMPIQEMLTSRTASGDSVSQAVGMFRNVSMTEADGVKTISYDYDVTELNALVGQVMDQAMASSEEQMQTLLPGYSLDLNVSSCSGSMRLGADNSLLGEKMDMTMHYVISGEGESLDMQIDMDIDYGFTSKGQPVQIPAIDPAQYTEIPSGGALLEQ